MSREDKTRDSNLYDENEAAANALFGDFLSQPTQKPTKEDFIGAKSDSPIGEGVQIGDPKGDVSFNSYLNELGQGKANANIPNKPVDNRVTNEVPPAMPEGSLSRAKKSMETGSFNPYGTFNEANSAGQPRNAGAVPTYNNVSQTPQAAAVPNSMPTPSAASTNPYSNVNAAGLNPAMQGNNYQQEQNVGQGQNTNQMQGMGFNPYAAPPVMGQGVQQGQMPQANQMQGMNNNQGMNVNPYSGGYQDMQQAAVNPYANQNAAPNMQGMYQQSPNVAQGMYQGQAPMGNQMQQGMGFNPYAGQNTNQMQNMYQQGQGMHGGQGVQGMQQENGFDSKWSQPQYDKPDRALEKYTQRIIASYSPKGGTGKSTVAQDLAYLFSHSTYLDKPMTVLLVDYDFTNGNVASRFGIRAQKTTATWGRQLEDTKEATGSYPVLDFDYIENHFVKKVSNNLDVICAPKDPLTQRYFTPELLDSMIKSFRKSRYDIIILDCANNVEDTTLELLKMSDDVLLIETIDKAAIEAGAAALSTMRELQMDTDKVKLVFNMVPEDKKIDLDTGDIVDMLNVPCIGSIPRNDEVRTSQNALGSLLEMYYPKETPYVKAYKEIASAVFPLDEKKKKGLFGGLFGKKKGKK